MFFRSNKDDETKPKILDVIERIIADPDVIKATVAKVRSRTRRRWPGTPEGADFTLAVADDLIDHYAKKAALVGVAATAVNMVPGFRNLVAVLGTAAADLALSLKLQVELVTGLGHLFGRDIERDDETELYLLMGGLGFATHAGAVAAEEFSIPALRIILRRLLKGRGKSLIWRIFRLITRALLGRGLARFVPAAIRVGLTYRGNKETTRFIGRRARDFFVAEVEDELDADKDAEKPAETVHEEPAPKVEEQTAKPEPPPEVVEKPELVSIELEPKFEEEVAEVQPDLDDSGPESADIVEPDDD